MKSVLVVAAHPDDEVLGCGGTIARLVSQGAEVNVLILGEGITSRQGLNETEKRQQVEILARQANEANKVLGVKNLYLKDLPDNKFDTVSLLDIIWALFNVP